MGEIKSVKVDNWGVFFLQKLQNFFNKTDYCDLTLQFNDNSQLKVHRLVLSACTDYFNVLEQTCEVVDDALIMPNELQADVVVPIVNFMYTGTLEFELKMYGKLLRTAKEMNMTVLLKLLEAHRRTMEGVNRTQCASPKSGVRKRGPILSAATTATTAPMAAHVRSSSNSSQVPQQRRLLPTTTASTTRRVVQTKSIATNVTTQSQQYRQQVATTSLLKVSPTVNISPNKSQRATYDESKSNEIGSMVSSYDSSIQFKEEQQDDYDQPSTSATVNQSTSPFEQLRKGYNNNKRPTSTAFISPPAKKPNIEDVKEFAEQQRVRKQIAAEYGEDQEYESTMLDDDIHNYDDDDDIAAPTPLTAPANASSSTTRETTLNTTGAGSGPPIRQQQSQSSIIIKQEPNEKPTIVVKDSSNSKMNHAKIISEVLRQYPHLVKSNKSIKLKIMPNIGGQSQKIIVKKEHIENIKDEANIQTAMAGNTTHNQPPSKPIQQQEEQQQKLQKQFQQELMHQQPQQALLKLSENPLPTQQTISSQKSTAMPSTTPCTTNALHETSKTAAGTQPQKRRIDSKTMHALIALGAENTTGPWLCLRCGVNGRPISIPSYRGFRRHLINTHKEVIDEALCEHCGWRSTTNRELHYHIHVEHKIKTTLYTFPECLMCAEIFIDTNALNQHMIESHPDENQQQCIYCNKIFAKEIQLFTHMKTYHKKQAIDDGIIDYSEDEDGDGGIDDDDDNAIEDNDDAENDSETEAMDTIQERTVSNAHVERNQSASSSSSSVNASNKKIKILSDISLPSTGSLMKLDSGRELESGINFETSKGLSNATHGNSSNIDNTDLGKEPKFVSADGNEMMLTEEQRKEIMSQLNQEHEGGVVMVLNESAFADGVETLSNTNEQTSLDHRISEQVGSSEHLDNSNGGQLVDGEEEEEDDDNDDEYIDENNIYRDFVRKNDDAEVKETSPSVLDESKGSMENLEWAENIITAHELEEEKQQHQEASKATTKQIEINKPTENLQDNRKHEDISQKLKELTGDWSDDEIDDAIDEVMVKPAAEFCTRKDIKVEDEKVEIEGTHVSDVEIKEEKKETNEDETKRTERKTGILNESNEIEKSLEKEPEDDIEMALKSLHKEEEEEEEEEEQQEEFIEQLKRSSDDTTNNAIVLTSNNEVEGVKMHEDAIDESAISSFKQHLGLAESDATEKRDQQSPLDELVKSEANEECIIKKENEENKDEESKAKGIEAILDDKEDKEKCTLEKLCPDTKEETETSAAYAVKETGEIIEATAKIEDSIGDVEMKEITNEPVECVTKSKTTEETIKTLMSEWVDDDDEEVIATIE